MRFKHWKLIIAAGLVIFSALFFFAHSLFPAFFDSEFRSQEAPRSIYTIESKGLEFVLTTAPTSSVELDRFATPTFGTTTVDQGFGTQSFDIQAGGVVDAFAFDNRCAGYVASVPNHVIDFQGQGLSQLEISATSGEDTTLLVMDPNGNVFCNDDANGTPDPSLSINSPAAGEYAVWVGTYSAAGNNFPDTVLTVSSASAAPTPPTIPTTPRPTAGLDPNQDPTFGLLIVGNNYGPETFDLQAGGDIEAFNVYNECNGYVAGAPDFVVEFEGSNRTPFDLSVFSADDTTLVVMDPAGNIFCNDDDVDLNPALRLSNPMFGHYAIWVGTFNPIQNDVYPEAQLTVSSGETASASESSPTIVSDTPCVLCDQLSESTIVFITPSELVFDEAGTFQLALVPEGFTIPDDGLIDPSAFGATEFQRNNRSSLAMEATLSGLDFEVSPSGIQHQSVLPNRGAIWQWQVKPTKFGTEQKLSLTIRAILNVDEMTSPASSQTIFSVTNPITVSFWDRLIGWSAEFAQVYGAMAAMVAVIVGAFSWLRRTTKKEK